MLNELGCGLRRLPEESLEELVVLPLTGDYRRIRQIRQNAEAVVAEVSERTAVEVEELVVELVERGRRLVRRLLARAAGPVGWGVFAAEVALEGLDAVTDHVDDARRLVTIIDRLLAMKDGLGSWVEEQRERLALLEDVAIVAREGLPVG